jgi:hypothetical protein
VSTDRPLSANSGNTFFPYSVPRPPNEAIVDHRRRPVGFVTIGPAAAALQHVHNAADNAAIVLPLDTAHVGRQARFDPLPLLVAQPQQIPAHDPNPSQKENQYVTAENLMSSHPNCVAWCASSWLAPTNVRNEAATVELRQHTSFDQIRAWSLTYAIGALLFGDDCAIGARRQRICYAAYIADILRRHTTYLNTLRAKVQAFLPMPEQSPNAAVRNPCRRQGKGGGSTNMMREDRPYGVTSATLWFRVVRR